MGKESNDDASADPREQEESSQARGDPSAVTSEKASVAPPEAREGQDGETWELPEDALILLPVRNIVLFPGVVAPVALGRRKSVEALQESVRRERPIGLLLQRDPAVEDPAPEDLHRVGTIASILRYQQFPEGQHQAICLGQKRFEVIDVLRENPVLVARVRVIEQEPSDDTETEARALHLRNLASEAIDLLPQAPPGIKDLLANITGSDVLADVVASYMDIPSEEKQAILEIFDVKARLEKVAERLSRLVEVMQISKEIDERTRGELTRASREHYLRQQLRTIQRELGEEEDPRQAEIAELRERIEAAKMPEEAEKQALQELGRLERLPEGAAEYSMIRTYLEWLVELPWSKTTESEIDLARARQVLDEDHYGLEKIKRRILEFLAVRKLKPDGKSAILCFAGPPGVGKTSLGRSIARAMGREFVRVSLGGTHDESEIRGHRRTYIGALPGNIIQGIRRAGTRDPVFMLDEIDKLSASFHGDPASALLEVLDPEQNSTFRDNYLGLPFDLSQVFFIATANVLENIPGPLRDRCEIIRLSGYTAQEKREIARRYLIPKAIDANGLEPDDIEILDDSLDRIITRYTREAGVRNLEQRIDAVCRWVAARIAEKGREIERPQRIGEDELRRILGAPQFENEAALRTSLTGVATGMAWTPLGGDILFVEATRMPGKGHFILTGQLGDVMKESAQAAISLVKANATRLGIEAEALERSDIHLHVPAGAIPKDGPSAGVTMWVALVSLLTGRKVRHDVAMTGEISLRGLVLPVGGIKEKVLAAHASGIRRILLPARNKKDEEEIPESVRSEIELVWLETVDDAMEAALEPEEAGNAAQVGAAKRG